jgi:hypothetical protein
MGAAISVINPKHMGAAIGASPIQANGQIHMRAEQAPASGQPKTALQRITAVDSKRVIAQKTEEEKKKLIALQEDLGM